MDILDIQTSGITKMLTRSIPMHRLVPINFDATRDAASATSYNTFNTSWLYSRLIQEAGRICENNASDILLEIDRIDRTIEAVSMKSNFAISYGLGFYKNGIDNWHIFSESSATHKYYKFYRIDMWATEGKIFVTLSEANYHNG